MLENIKIIALALKIIIWSLFPPTLLYAVTRNMTLSVSLWFLIAVAEVLYEIALAEPFNEQDFQNFTVEVSGEKE
jgi:hypothetical protein